KFRGMDLPLYGKNLYLDLMQQIAEELNVTKCWICGGSQMTEQWPWKGEGLSPEQILKWNRTERKETGKMPEGWILSHEVIGHYCIQRVG
ncbi:ENR1 protein, partial [Eudromia elegans]|nr:ENR1 protein [Eudromia elegans]